MIMYMIYLFIRFAHVDEVGDHVTIPCSKVLAQLSLKVFQLNVDHYLAIILLEEMEWCSAILNVHTIGILDGDFKLGESSLKVCC